MVQLPADIPLRVIDDLGPVGQGASSARYVRAENGQEYIIKGPALTPNHRYVGANEYIAVRLARQLGVPVLDDRLVELNGELYWASAWMTTGSYRPFLDAGVLDRCENKDRVYPLVTLDSWICNVDRHEHNLLARSVGRAGDQRLAMLANDHSHCLVLPGKTPAELPDLLDTPPGSYIRLGFVAEAVKDVGLLGAAISGVEGIADHLVEAIVRSVPDALLPAADQDPLTDFLVQRKARLRGVFVDGRTFFTQLGGGPL